MKLEDIPGVGKAIAEKLREGGIETPEDLEGMSVDDLVELGVPKATAKKILKWFHENRHLTVMTGKQYKELDEKRLVLRTHTRIDNLLDGGLKETYLVEAYGQFATGKTQLAHQLAVVAQLPVKEGGLDGRVMYIDTENTFSPKRIEAIAERFGIDPDTALDRILVVQAVTSDDLYAAAKVKLKSLLREHEGVKLIIIDSITAPFRSEYVDLNKLPERQKKLGEILMSLHEVALGLMDGVPKVVYYTNQVTTRIGGFINPLGAEIHVGGNIMGHRAQYRLYMRKSSGNKRIVRIVDAHDRPSGEVVIEIKNDGLY